MYALRFLVERDRRDTVDQWQHPAVRDTSNAIGCPCSECIANSHYNQQTLRTMRYQSRWVPSDENVQYTNGNAPIVTNSPFATMAHDQPPFIAPQVPFQWNQESASYAPMHESLGHIQAQTAHDISNNLGVLINAIDLQPGNVDQLRVVVIVLVVGDSA
ncbi:hypothetical protein BC826DRAFT_966994 [Russula brevipes]|nr:hypothetical protein BC826DRAFT_966994 [Russula brevipes]